jgi:hypothetical protein
VTICTTRVRIVESEVRILRDDGIVTAGESMQHATMRVSAEVACGRAPAGGARRGPQEPSELGSSFNDQSRWRHYTGRLDVAGLPV